MRRVERRTLRHGPRQQHAVVLEAEVVVKMAGEVLLDAEEAIGFLCGRLAGRQQRARGFGGFLEVAFCLYFSSGIGS